MVVFQDARAEEGALPQVRACAALEGQDDFAAMEEVVSRRFARLGDVPADEYDESFAASPNLVVDRRRQGAARGGARGDAGVRPAARRGDRAREAGGGGVRPRAARTPVGSTAHSPGLQLLQRIRDEAHRFALGFHRQRRDARRASRSSTSSRASARRGGARCSRHSARSSGLLAATPEELEGVPGVPAKTARSIYAQLHKAGRGMRSRSWRCSRSPASGAAVRRRGGGRRRSPLSPARRCPRSERRSSTSSRRSARGDERRCGLLLSPQTQGDDGPDLCGVPPRPRRRPPGRARATDGAAGGDPRAPRRRRGASRPRPASAWSKTRRSPTHTRPRSGESAASGASRLGGAGRDRSPARAPGRERRDTDPRRDARRVRPARARRCCGSTASRCRCGVDDEGPFGAACGTKWSRAPGGLARRDDVRDDAGDAAAAAWALRGRVLGGRAAVAVGWRNG